MFTPNNASLKCNAGMRKSGWIDNNKINTAHSLMDALISSASLNYFANAVIQLDRDSAIEHFESSCSTNSSSL